MSELALGVKITADGRQFVGQMDAAATKAAALKAALGGTATEARDLARATDETAKAQRSAAASAAQLTTGERAVGAAAAEAAREHQRLAVAQGKVIGVSGQQRAGFVQLGQQLQDVSVGLVSGQRASTVFAQQLPQLAFALQNMGGEGAGATGKLAVMSRFLTGPLGIALTVAIPIIALFAGKLFESADASAAAQKASEDLAQQQASIANFFNLSTGAILENNQALIQNAVLQRIVARRGEDAAASSRQTRIRQIITSSDDQPYSTRGVGRGQGDVSIRRPANTDLVDAIGAESTAAGRARAIASIAQGRGTNAAGATELLGLLSQAELGRRNSLRLDRETSSLTSGNLAGSLRTPGHGGRGGGGGSAEAAARRANAELERQRNLAEQAGASIGRINDQWNAQPRLIDAARQDGERLNAIIAELEEKRPPNFAALVTQAREARGVIQTGLLKQFNDMVDASQRQSAIQILTLQGREQEADVLGRINRLHDAGLNVTAEQRAEVERIVAHEQQINDLLDQRDAILGAYKQSIGDLRSSLTALLSGGSVAEFGRNLMHNAQRLRGELLTEQLFGPPLRELEREIRQSTGLEGTVAALDVQVTSTVSAFGTVEAGATSLAAALTGAADALDPSASIARGNSDFSASLDDLNRSFTANFLDAIAKGEDPNNRTINVLGRRDGQAASATITSMRPNDYFQRVAAVLTAPITRLLAQLDETIGTHLAGRLGGVLQGGVAGFLQAGKVGGILGALNGAGFGGKAGALLGKASDGAATGAQVAQIGAQFGLKTSSTGGSIGGALGAASGLPGGELIGSIIGSIAGGLFKKAKTGVATITNTTADAALSGNNKAFQRQAGDAASSVQSALQSIADQLGGTLGNFAVSLAIKDGKYFVDPSGKGATKTKKGAIGFGEDGSAAVSAAIIDAISDGGVTGLSAAMQKALKSSPDLDRAMREALKVQQVEDIIGGLGATLARQFSAFEGQAKDRVRVASQYGFDVVKIEARNAEDRKKLVDQLLEDRVGSLTALLKDLAFGDLFEGSASDRRTALLGEVAKAKVDAEAGKDGAAQKLADLSRQLVETSRDAYGTAGAEFASDRAGAISSAEKVIALENERIKAAQDAAVGTKAALDTNNRLTNESNDLLAQIAAQIANLGTLGIAQNSAPGAFDIGRQVAL